MRIAQDRGQSFSRTIAALLRTAMRDSGGAGSVEVDPSTGLPTVHVRGRLTAQDVAAADE